MTFSGLLFFKLSRIEETLPVNNAQTHRLKTPFTWEQRNTMNDSTMILCLSSQRSTLLVTPTQHRITVWQHSSLPLFIPKVLIFPWPLEPQTPYTPSAHSLPSSSTCRKHKLWATKSAHTFSCAAEAQGLGYKNSHMNIQLTKDSQYARLQSSPTLAKGLLQISAKKAYQVLLIPVRAGSSCACYKE